jgi:hypothetical protein
MIMVREHAEVPDAAPEWACLQRSIRGGVEELHPAMRAESVRIRTVREEHRPTASLYELDLDDAGATMSLLVKVPLVAAPGSGDRRVSRPRLVDQPDAILSRTLEHAALAAIHEHFTALGDPRFGTIRVFDGVAPPGALVMERLHQPSLRSLLMRAQRWRPGGDDERLRCAFANAGAWLRRYHGMEPGEHALVRHARRGDVVAHCEAIAAWAGPRIRQEAFLRAAAAEIGTVAERVLPDPLPLGLSHGDFALRNVLVSDAGRTTVCDTRSRWVTAIYEDLGYFLAWLRWNWPQLYSFGLAFDPRLLDRCEREFLHGYFADAEVPVEALRVYRLVALLDRLAEEVVRGANAARWKGALLQSPKIALLVRVLRMETRSLAAGRADATVQATERR